jgi:glycosyltransferase involved in cell wall biosynthesis
MTTLAQGSVPPMPEPEPLGLRPLPTPPGTPASAADTPSGRASRAPRPRVLFAALQEPQHHLSFSGAYHQMARALSAEGLEVTVPGHDVPLAVRLKRMLPLGRFQSPMTRRPRQIAEAIASSLALGEGRAVVFSPCASALVPHLPSHVPLVYFSDATPRLIEDYWPEEAPEPDEREEHDALERAALRRATRLVYPSRWAAESAVRDYGAAPGAITIAPFGSPLEPTRADALARRLTSPLRLLWVGGDWRRKGGETAVETVAALRRAGVEAQLHMCGARGHGWNADGVIHHGFLDRGKRAHRRLTYALMRECHLFLLPTRADCSPLVLAEAAAWGMPAVTTRVGGVPEIVEDGETGLLVDADATPAAYADALRAITATPSSYERFAEHARAAYERRLTWRQWAAIVGAAVLAADAG